MKTRLAMATSLGAAIALAISVTVLGHAQLVTSDPPIQGTIKTPYTLSATFDDELTPDGSSIVVEDSTGAKVASGTVSPTDDKTMTADLPALPDGQYQVLWTAVSADDKAIERGQYQFSVGTASGSSAPATPAASAAPGQSTGSGNDLLLPLGVVVVLVAAIAGYFVYRSRR